MGNLYFVTEDGEVYDDGKDIPEGKPSIMVHGWRDLEKVLCAPFDFLVFVLPGEVMLCLYP